jgi:hypothetical protein
MSPRSMHSQGRGLLSLIGFNFGFEPGGYVIEHPRLANGPIPLDTTWSLGGSKHEGLT